MGWAVLAGLAGLSWGESSNIRFNEVSSSLAAGVWRRARHCCRYLYLYLYVSTIESLSGTQSGEKVGCWCVDSVDTVDNVCR